MRARLDYAFVPNFIATSIDVRAPRLRERKNAVVPETPRVGFAVDRLPLGNGALDFDEIWQECVPD